MIVGVRALGRAVGKSHVAVSVNWLKHPEWPYSRKGPWREALVPKMVAWAAATLSGDPAKEGGQGDGQTTKSKAQTILAIRRAEQVKVVTDKMKGELHSVAQCKANVSRMIEEAKRRLLAVPDTLPFETAVREEVRRAIWAALDDLADGP